MATTYAFTRTLAQMQSLILRRLRYLDPGESVASADATIVEEAINLRLRELHALGTLWFNVAGATTDITITANTAASSLSTVTDFLYAVSCKVVIGSDENPVAIISHQEYQDISNKAESGDPEKVFFAPSGTAYFWPVPTQNRTAKLTYQAITGDAAAGVAPDVAISMLRSLVTLVAADLIDDYGVPESLAQRLLMQAKEAERTIRALNTERVGNTVITFESF